MFYPDKRRASLEEQLDRLVTIAETIQTALGKELEADGLKGILKSDLVNKTQKLASTLEMAGRARIALAKAEKLLGGRMSPEQVLQAARKKILSMPYLERARFLEALVGDHLAERPAAQDRKGDGALKAVLEALKKQAEPGKYDAPNPPGDG